MDSITAIQVATIVYCVEKYHVEKITAKGPEKSYAMESTFVLLDAMLNDSYSIVIYDDLILFTDLVHDEQEPWTVCVREAVQDLVRTRLLDKSLLEKPDALDLLPF